MENFQTLLDEANNPSRIQLNREISTITGKPTDEVGELQKSVIGALKISPWTDEEAANAISKAIGKGKRIEVTPEQFQKVKETHQLYHIPELDPAIKFLQKNLAKGEKLEITQDELAAVREAYFKQHEKELPPSLAEKAAVPIIKSLGYTVGTLNAPLAFLWGSINSFNKRTDPWWRAGMKSAWKSMSKQGDWGTGYLDYYRDTTGEDLNKTLGRAFGVKHHDNPYGYAEDFAKQRVADILSGIIGVGVDTVSDPLILAGMAKSFAKGRWIVPKNFKGRLPEEWIKQLDEADRVMSRFSAKDRARALKITADKIKESIAIRKQALSELERYHVRDKLIEKENEVGRTLTNKEIHNIVSEVKNNRVLSSTKSKLVKALPKEPSGLKRYELPYEKSVKKGPLVVEKVFPKAEIPDHYKEVVDYILEGKRLGRRRPSPESGLEVVKRLKINDYRKQQGINSIEKPNLMKIREAKRKKILGPINEFRRKKGLEEFHAVAGVGLGFDIDDNGNVTIDPEKALLGMVGGIALRKVTKLKNVARMTKAERAATEVFLKENPEAAKLVQTIGKEGEPFAFGPWARKLVEGGKQKFFDRLALLEKVSPETYRLATTMNAVKDRAYMQFAELKNVFKDFKDKEFEATALISAERDINYAKNGIPGKIPYDTAVKAKKQIINKLLSEGKTREQINKMLTGWKKWTDKILTDLEKGGIISSDAVKAIRKRNEFYATTEVLKYLPEDLNKIPFLPSSDYFSVGNQKIIQSLKGMEEGTLVRDPISATIDKFMKAKNLIARNEVASTLIDDPKVNKQFYRVADNQSQYYALQKKGERVVMPGTWDKNLYDTINRFKNGKVEKYIVPSDIAKVMKNLTPWQAPKIVKAYNSVFRKAATTLSPKFMISNAPRDFLLAYISSPVYKKDIFGLQQARDWGKGFVEAFKHEFGNGSKLMNDYIRDRGTFGYTAMEEVFAGSPGYVNDIAKTKLFADKTLAKKGIRVLSKPAQVLEKINSVLEMATRLGVYKRAGEQGIQGVERGMLGRTASIDFNKMGELVAVLNQFVPFTGARFGAVKTIYDALKSNPKTTMTKMLTGAVLPGLAAYAWNKTHYPDLLDDIPKEIRDYYYVLITGETIDENGKKVPEYLVISGGDPKSIVWNPLEYGIERIAKKDPRGVRKFLINYLNDISPMQFAVGGKVSGVKTLGSVTPQIMKGAIEQAFNKNLFTTRPIESEVDLKKPAELRYDKKTPELYKKLGKILGMSPKILQNWGQSVFAGYGKAGFSPKLMLEGIEGRIIKRQGGQKAYTAGSYVYDEIIKGYNTTRAYAEEAMRQGDIGKALKLMDAWNAGLTKKTKKVGELGYPDKGGLISKYLFTARKKKYLLRKVLQEQQTGKRTFIERQISKK